MADDGKHARKKLQEIHKFSRMLLGRIHEGDDLPEWIMDKLVLAANDLNESYQYLDTKASHHSAREKVRAFIRSLE